MNIPQSQLLLFLKIHANVHVYVLYTHTHKYIYTRHIFMFSHTMQMVVAMLFSMLPVGGTVSIEICKVVD